MCASCQSMSQPPTTFTKNSFTFVADQLLMKVDYDRVLTGISRGI